jgi:N6-L-threonylcarbamoyladenine synthase
VLRYVKREQAAGRDIDTADLAASFQEAIVEVQVDKTVRAAIQQGVKTIFLGGGVVANSRLREQMAVQGGQAGLRVSFPPLDLCTDNAAMIACLGASRLALGERTSLDIGADPQLKLLA